jgi:hypothetical protein
MRRFLLILLIALLPLRAWVGDSMAIPTSSTAVAASSHCAEMMAGADAATTDNAPKATDTTTLSCTQCQLCHLLGLAVAEFTPLLPALPAARITPVPTHFASAEPTQGFKPPLL